MTMPGFAADRVFPALTPVGGDTPADRKADCIQACRDQGLSLAECGRRCNPQTPPYQCTPQDNSVNNALCLGGVGAWQIACSAECGLLKGVGPIVGDALAAACSAGCDALAANMRATCPPATICV
jgi:hypothetical protein